MKNTSPEKKTRGKIEAFIAPNQGVERSFCCWIAGQRVAQKECSFRDTGGSKYKCLRLTHSNPLLSHSDPGAPSRNRRSTPSPPFSHSEIPAQIRAYDNHNVSMLCYIIICYTILYYTIIYYTILYYNYTIPYYTMLCYAMLYYTILYWTILSTGGGPRPSSCRRRTSRAAGAGPPFLKFMFNCFVDVRFMLLFCGYITSMVLLLL